MKAILPFLFILVCPVMMLFMMRGMHGHGAHGAREDATADPRGMQGGNDDPRVVGLLEQRDQLEARVEELEAQMGRLERPREEVARDAQEPRVLTPM